MKGGRAITSPPEAVQMEATAAKQTVFWGHRFPLSVGFITQGSPWAHPANI